MSVMRKYINLLEGDYIPLPERTIKLDTSAYQLARALQSMGDPDKYQNEIGQDSVLSFYSQEEYQRVISWLRALGIKFKDAGQK